MSEADADRRRIAALRSENEALRAQLGDAQRALEAVARGEVDAVAMPEVGSPLLLRAAQESLRESQALLRAIFDGSRDALILLDDESSCRDANPAACELFSLAREELLGKPLGALLPGDFDLGPHLPSFIAEGQMRGQFTLERPDGGARVLDLNAAANVTPGLHLAAIRDITHRVAAEDALRRNEVRFRAMIEKGQDGITLLNADVRAIYHSPAVERLLGHPLDDERDVLWHELVDDDERPKLASALAKLMKGPGATTNLEFPIRRGDGSRVWLELTATNRLEDPDVNAIILNFRDITERKSFEEEREGFFRLSLDLLCVAGLDGRFRRLNPAWERTLGWSVEELCARPWLDFVHPDDREVTEYEGARLAEGRVVVRFENRYRCKDGSYRWLKWAAIPTTTGLIYACAHDVTGERAAAQRDRLLFSGSPLPMWLVDIESLRLLDVNDAAVRGYGYGRDELLSMTLADLVVEEEVRPTRNAMRRLSVEGTIVVPARRHRTKGGEERHVELTCHLLDLGERRAALSVAVDVTEARRLGEERAHHVERLRLLELSVSRLNDVVIITRAAPLSEPGPEIVYVNEALERIAGYAAKDAVGRTPRMLQGPDTDRAALARVRAALERGEPIREEIINYTRDGFPYWVEVDITPVRDDAGALTHFVAVERDTTERHRAADELRELQTRLHQAQKMEAIGRLAGGIAHDFNNVLSVILSYTSLGIESLPAADPLRQDLEEVHKAGLRATDMTSQLLAFGRKQILQPVALDVAAAIRAVEKMLRRLVGEDVELSINTAPDTGRAYVDPSQFEQVLLNLVVNARDAMPAGGTMQLETTSVLLDDAYSSRHPGVSPGRYVLLTVSDNGTGMDRATQERVFEPFFTTKERGKGTGLGLSIVYGIVQQSGGHIELDSEPARGTTFRIHLPRTDRPGDALAPSAPPVESLRGSETILLVEDEAQVRQVVHNVLRKSGYHVLEAQNAGEALLASEQFEGTIHLLVSDVVMPRMSGRQLADRLTALRPEMKVLFISGYTEDTIGHHGVLDPGIELLAKPILPAALLNKVRQVLDRPPRPRPSESPG